MKDEEIEKLRSEALLSKDEAAEVGRLRSVLKSSESAHATEVSLLKEQVLRIEAELRAS